MQVFSDDCSQVHRQKKLSIVAYTNPIEALFRRVFSTQTKLYFRCLNVRFGVVSTPIQRFLFCVPQRGGILSPTTFRHQHSIVETSSVIHSTCSLELKLSDKYKGDLSKQIVCLLIELIDSTYSDCVVLDNKLS